MTRIAIVDDEIEQAVLIEKYVKKFVEMRNIDAIIEIRRDGSELIKTSALYDLIFLDINMPEINGIELARKIRQANHKLHIVYITGYTNYRDAAFTVHAYGYIMKPVSQEKIVEILNDFFNDLRDKRNTTVLKTSDGSNYFADISNICYFEYDGNRKIKVHMYNKECIRISTTMSELIKKYGGYGFASPHKSFLVNMERVIAFDMKESRLILDNGNEIDVAWRKQKEFQKILSEYFHKRLESK